MSKADKDAEKWQQMNQRTQERTLIRAKEQGDAYYINQFGEVVIPQEGKPAAIVTTDEFCRKTTLGEN